MICDNDKLLEFEFDLFVFSELKIKKEEELNSKLSFKTSRLIRIEARILF